MRDGVLVGGAADWTADGDPANSRLGYTVSAAGDVTADGYADAWMAGSGSGRRLYYGNDHRGVSLRPEQVRGSDGTTLVQLLGSSRSATQINLRLRTARSWMGRSRARLQWEVRPLGVDFSSPATCGAACGVSPWTDIGTLGSQIQSTVTLPTPSADKAYHWRVRVLTFPSFTGPWVSIGPNASSETDFRTPP